MVCYRIWCVIGYGVLSDMVCYRIWCVIALNKNELMKQLVTRKGPGDKFISRKRTSKYIVNYSSLYTRTLSRIGTSHVTAVQYNRIIHIHDRT